MRRNWALWIAIAATVCGLLLAYQSAVFSSRSGDAAPLYSARRHDPYGTAALYALLAERDVPIRTLERATLEPADRGVLIQAHPNGVNLGTGTDYRLQTRHIADWISQGNTVVQLTRTPTDLMNHFGIQPAGEVDAETLKELWQAESKGENPEDVPGVVYMARLTGPTPGRLFLRAPMTFAERTEDRSWTVLARAATFKDAIVAAEYRVGRGRLILVGAPTPALNHTIGSEANLNFLLAAIGSGPVIIDEWSHGIGHHATIMGFILSAGLLPMLLQVVFVIGLFVWGTVAYRGGTENDVIARSRSGIEQIETLGFLYDRSLGREVTYERVKLEVDRRLTEALRCREKDIASRIALKSPDVQSRYARLCERLEEVRPAYEVRCPTCRYDLRGNQTGRCPECGEAIPIDVHRRLTEASEKDPRPQSRKSIRSDAALVEALTLSHKLSEEIRSDPRRVAN